MLSVGLRPFQFCPVGAVILVLLGGGCRPEGEGGPTLKVAGHAIAVEVVRTPEELSRGLQHRGYLSPDRGMLFVFPRLVRSPFWMKDTLIPLTIAFIDPDGRIVDIQKMNPDDGKELHYSRAPYRYALEVNQGWFEKNRIGIGEKVELSGVH